MEDMNLESEIRIGFIGAGGIFAQRHLPGLQQIGTTSFVAVCNRSEASSRNVAEQWGIEHVEMDPYALIARHDIDAVCIGTYPNTHADFSCAALEAGKHVFCQARMADTLANAQRMLDTAKAHPHLVSMICPPPHRMPWEPWLLRMVGEELGDLQRVELISVNDSCLNPQQVTWREIKENNGLQMLQVGIWAETLHVLVGEYQELRAECSIPIPEKVVDEKVVKMDVPQRVTILGTNKAGIPISEIHSGVSSETPALNRLTLHGERGVLQLNAMDCVAFAPVGEELQKVNVPEAEQRDWWAESQFIEAIQKVRSGRAWEVDPSFDDGMKYMRKMAAIELSVRLESATVRLDAI